MARTFRTTFVTVLLCVSVQWTCCSGKIFLCSDTDGAHNGTAVRATIGEPVNVSFCVDTDNEVNYIIIQPPYPASTQDRVSKVRIVNDRTRAIINITINPVVQSDFSERFNVTVFRKPLSSGTLLLWFQLEKKENETTPRNKVELTTQPVLRSDVEPRCLPKANSSCPENWYPVDDHRCLQLFQRSPGVYPIKQCALLGANLLERGDIIELKSCLEYLLKSTTVKVVRSNGKNYNVQTGMVVSENSYYLVPCTIKKSFPGKPNITDFYIEDVDYSSKGKNSLLLGGVSSVEHNISGGALNVVCSATGYPAPEVTLSRDNVTLPNSSGGVLTIATPSCLDSGLYACHARNLVNSTQAQRRIQFRSPIKVDPVLFTNNRTGISQARQGDHVMVKCSVTGCPTPKQLTLANDANLTLDVFGKSSVVHEISSAQCSDMGTYLCRAEVEQLEEKGELLLEGCPIQFCRGQKKSGTISRNLEQTTSFSVCLMSDERPTWENTFEIKNISVVFTQRPGSRIYFSAEISFSKNPGDGAYIIVMKNRHGNLFYSITLEPDDRLAEDSHQQPPVNELTSLLPIILPLVLIVFIVLAVIGLVVYRRKARRYKEAITAMSARLETSNTNGNASNDKEEARYETIHGKDVDNSIYLIPISSEYEAAAAEYSVILEY